ncbi:hypothetical protein M9H77_27377 [Catharanthus roseus]|uniref:Uncharacterized protein n=1 Tax=Catharanthus roseus TaxID=4058 RepID=A0ACC0ACQ5_CATRO|nr:hypothetical protein M9H77_27377 [Catharanthus roseus]
MDPIERERNTVEGVARAIEQWCSKPLKFYAWSFWIRWYTILMGGYTRRARLWAGPAGLYRHHLSLREIIPKRDPVPVVDLSDGESVKGPAVQGVEFGALMGEDTSKPKSDSEMVVEPEEWHWLTLRRIEDAGQLICGAEE